MSELLDTARWFSKQLVAAQDTIKALSAPQLGTSSIESGTVAEYDSTGALVSSVGTQFDGTHAAVTLGGPVPPEPSAPIITPGANTAEVRWDGTFVDGALSPMDFSHVTVHASQLESFTPDNTTQRATITGESGDTATVALDAGEWYFLLIAVSKAGKWSDHSDAVLAEVTDAQQDVITDTLSGFDDSLTGVQTSVNGKNTITNQTVTPSTNGTTVGDRWQVWSTLAAGGKLLSTWRWDGTQWLQESIDPTYLPQVDIGAGTYGTLDGGRLSATAIDGKTITGPTIQTTATANRGIKLTPAGLMMWDATGKQTMNLDAPTGTAVLTGRLRTGPDGQPGVVLIPPGDSDDGKTMAVWFAPDTAALPGGVTAGMWMSNAAGGVTTPAKLNLRGQSGGGLYLYDGMDVLSSSSSVPYISSHHAAGLQMTSYSGILYLVASNNELRIQSMFNTVINVGMSGGGGKYLTLQQDSAPYASTLSGSANLILQTDGNLFKVSSASKYKILPEVMALDDRLLDEVAVKDWIDLGMAERFADSFNQMGPMTEQQDLEFRALSLERIPGAIAEDVEAAGGERFVVRGLDGELESLMYDRFALARTEILKARAAEQAAEIAELRQMVADLAARIPAQPTT